MRFYFLTIAGLGVLTGATYWLCRSTRDVSHEWMVDHARRDWSAGVDQVSIRWPIKKVVNEAGRFNAAKLRRRA